jgi:hypothetical protein
MLVSPGFTADDAQPGFFLKYSLLCTCMVPLPILVQSRGCHELWKKVEIFPPVPVTVNVSSTLEVRTVSHLL